LKTDSSDALLDSIQPPPPSKNQCCIAFFHRSTYRYPAGKHPAALQNLNTRSSASDCRSIVISQSTWIIESVARSTKKTSHWDIEAEMAEEN
jgi:hypothetical protein